MLLQAAISYYKLVQTEFGIFFLKTLKKFPEYIDVVLRHHRCSKLVGEIALRMYSRIAQSTSFSGRYPSMLAMTIVNLAAKECYEDIPSTAWSGYDTCSYPKYRLPLVFLET